MTENECLRMKKFIELHEEGEPTNVTGAAVAVDQPIVRRDRFANKEVFEVDDCFYQKCINGKKKYAKYADYVGSDETGEAIRQYGRSNPKSSIIVRNKNTQNMMFLRRINEETGEEIMDTETEINESAIAGGILMAFTGIVFAHGYYEMTRDVYQKLKRMIETRRKVAMEAGKGELTNYQAMIDAGTEQLEKIFAKAKIIG